jgi:uncharacterized protein (DUF302 family)
MSRSQWIKLENEAMPRVIISVMIVLLVASSASAGSVNQRDGWVVIDSNHSYAALVQRLEAAVKAENMGLVTSASASEGAKAAGIAIPGNRVVGVFRNDFARRMLSASTSAGIEAPIRLYMTENPGGGATLSYKKPSFVFTPYFGEGGDALKALAAELDEIFARIADAATKDK